MFDISGRVKPIFDCDTLDRFDNPPCEIIKYHATYIDVSSFFSCTNYEIFLNEFQYILFWEISELNL